MASESHGQNPSENKAEKINQSSQSPPCNPAELQSSQNEHANDRPNDKPDHHRGEVKTWGVLSLWIFGDLLIGLGYEHTGVWVLAAAIWLSAGFFTYHAVKVWPRCGKKLCVLYAVVCVASPFILRLSQSDNARKSIQPTFSIVARESIVELEKHNHFLSFALGNMTNAVVAPIPISIWFEFTNLKGVPLTISSCQFECKTTNGNWAKMQTIDSGAGWIYFARNSDLHQASRYNPGPDVFPYSFRGKTIGAGESVSMWVFLEPPRNGYGGLIRLHIINSGNNEMFGLVEQDKAATLGEITHKWPPWEPFRPEDMSNAKLVDYAEVLGGN
jgi:hypothetical protein